MARRNYNKLTRSNILAHMAVNAAVDDIRALYGAAGVALADKLVAEGAGRRGTRNGFPVYHAVLPVEHV
jgi:hypothetical protein